MAPPSTQQATFEANPAGRKQPWEAVVENLGGDVQGADFITKTPSVKPISSDEPGQPPYAA